jgi:hypothetical protein
MMTASPGLSLSIASLSAELDQFGNHTGKPGNQLTRFRIDLCILGKFIETRVELVKCLKEWERSYVRSISL